MDDVKIGTAESLFLLAQTLAGNQIASKLMWAKSPYVGKCRNMLVSAFFKTQVLSTYYSLMQMLNFILKQLSK
jgi:hypothetical protein